MKRAEFSFDLPEELIAQHPASERDGSRLLVVEQNHTGQLYRYLRAMVDLPGRPKSFHRPGPLPLRPGELATWIAQQADSLMGEPA